MILIAIVLSIAAALLLFSSGWLLAARYDRSVRAALHAELLRYGQREASLEKSLEEVFARAASLETQLNEARMRVDAADQKLAEVKALADASSERLADAHARVASLSAELGEAKMRARAFETQLNEARILVTTLERRASSEHVTPEVNALRAMLSPMLEREAIAQRLSRLKTTHGSRDLPMLLDAIADAGGFSSVVLSDDVGLPLAASANASAIPESVDRLVGMASLVLMLADRALHDGEPKPIGVVTHDESNRMVIHRIFGVDKSRFLLTAAARGKALTPSVLDPIVGKLEAVLARRTFAA